MLKYSLDVAYQKNQRYQGAKGNQNRERQLFALVYSGVLSCQTIQDDVTEHRQARDPNGQHEEEEAELIIAV
jgi:hypothetical protein